MNKRKESANHHFILAVIAAFFIVVALAAGPGFAAKTGKMSTPTIECAGSGQTYIDVRVTAGATGAPAGFSIQWMTLDDFTANGGWYASDDPRLCKGSFSGNANLSRYNLRPGDSVTVRIGDLLLDQGASTTCPGELACDTEYVFRAFAHATSTLNRSEFTPNLQCRTEPCEGVGNGCTLTQGYWKTHEDAWPVDSLTLGTVEYTKSQLLAILNTSVGGNGLIALAHQLIAAKLNVAAGADPTAVASYIAQADTMISGLVIPPVGSGFLKPSVTSDLVYDLDSYNSGGIGPGHCND